MLLPATTADSALLGLLVVFLAGVLPVGEASAASREAFMAPVPWWQGELVGKVVRQGDASGRQKQVRKCEDARVFDPNPDPELRGFHKDIKAVSFWGLCT